MGIKIEPNELGVSMSSPRIVRFYNINPKVNQFRFLIQRILTPTFSFFLLLLSVIFLELCLHHVTHVINDANVTHMVCAGDGCAWL